MSVEVASLLTILIILLVPAGIVKILCSIVEIADHHRRVNDEKAGEAAKSPLNDIAPYQPPKVYETYDHPAAPVALLGASLCRAPLGYGWEITTTINQDENPALRLAMLDLKTTTEVDVIERDMVIVRKWQYADDDTYAAFYRRAKEIETIETDAQANSNPWIYDKSGKYVQNRNYQPAIKGNLAGRVMMANLITPMVDWAALLTLRYIVENPDETKCNYMLIESMGGQNAGMVHS